MRLRKLKYHGEGSPVEIVYDEHNGRTGKHDHFTFACEEPPRDVLVLALVAMAAHALDFCGLDASDDDAATVKSVSISYDSAELQGLVITASLDVEGARGPFNFNTPRFTRPENAEDEFKDGVFSKQCADDLDRLEKLAFAYLHGDRAQLDLGLEAPASGGIRILDGDMGDEQAELPPAGEPAEAPQLAVHRRPE